MSYDFQGYLCFTLKTLKLMLKIAFILDPTAELFV